MKTIKSNPTSNSIRHTKLLQKSLLIKNNKIFKNLRTTIKKCYGHSATTGHITSWHKQRGAKKLYKTLISDKQDSKSIVLGANHDPNRNALTSVNFDLITRTFFNDIFVQNTYPGSLVYKAAKNIDLKNGNRLQLKNIPAGTLISNISKPFCDFGKYAKSAGTFAQLIQKNRNSATVRLPSNTEVNMPVNSLATIGTISNGMARGVVIGKAGRSRNLGRRPIVRGIAMNPVDHPHGGRTNGGRPSVTPWGLPTKGKFKLKRRGK